MLSLTEYVAASNDLLKQAQLAESEVVRGAPALGAYMNYYGGFQNLLYKYMLEVSSNTIEHYAAVLHIEPDYELAQDIADKQFHDEYYGLSLRQRLAINQVRLTRLVHQSSLVNKEDRVLTSTVPFGAHYHTDKRVLLGTLVKIEQDVAKASAAKANIKLIRWTLSHRHAKADICDDLANMVDRSVVDYLEKNKLKISPKGLYFVNELPHPPHPNCQCEYGMVDEQGTVHMGPLERTFQKIASLLRKITRQ